MGHAVGSGIAGDLAHFPGVVCFAATENDGHARFMQRGGIIQAGTKGIEIGGQVVQGIEDDGYLSLRKCSGHHPGLPATVDNTFEFVLLYESQHAHDVCSPVCGEDKDAILAGGVQCLNAPDTEKVSVLVSIGLGEGLL